MRNRNIYRNSISRITRSAVVLAAALPALLLPSGCERENLLKEIAGEEAVMRFSVSESVPELLTKSADNGKQKLPQPEQSAVQEENVIVLTSADGRTLRLIAEEEPLTAHTYSASASGAAATPAAPATKAAKIYSQSAALADDETFAVWAYNLADSNSPTNTWQLDGGTGTTPAEAKKVTGQNLWKPDADIQYNTSNRTSSYKTRWFALAPYGAYSGTKASVSSLVIHENQAPTFTYTVPSAIEDQWDLLAATTASRDVADVSPVSLTFGHVLTGIRFKRDKDLDISSITVSGVYNSARIDMSKLDPSGSMESFTNVDGTSASGATTDLWSNRTKSVTAPATEPSWTMDMTASGTWTNGNPKETQYDYAAKDDHILMMIPQLTPQGAKITVTINGEPYTGDISGHRWLPGRLVTYRINNPSYFKVTLVSMEMSTSTFTGVTTTEAPGGGVVADGGLIECTGYAQRFSFSVAASEDLGFDAAEVEISPGAAKAEGYSTSTTPRGVAVYLSNNNDLGRDPGLTKFLPFSISAAKKVTFSPGNLQYRASTGTWRFARRQWDYVGGTNVSQEYGTVFEGDDKSSNNLIAQYYNGWIDLFGWGTTGYNYNNLSTTEYQPWTNSNVDGNYGQRNGLTKDGDKPSDWGANMGEGYYTLSCPISGHNEWEYLVQTRATTYPDNCSYLKSSIMPAPGVYREVTITFRAKNDPSYAVRYTVRQTPVPVSGLLLFPDGFPKTDSRVSSYSNINQRNVGWTQLPWDSWLSLQASGCVFLPAAGTRQAGDAQILFLSQNPESNDLSGSYWSRSYRNPITAGGLWFSPSQVSYNNPYRSRGCSVRLVKDVE